LSRADSCPWTLITCFRRRFCGCGSSCKGSGEEVPGTQADADAEARCRKADSERDRPGTEINRYSGAMNSKERAAKGKTGERVRAVRVKVEERKTQASPMSPRPTSQKNAITSFGNQIPGDDKKRAMPGATHFTARESL